MKSRIILTLIATMIIAACQSSPSTPEAAQAESPDSPEQAQPIDQEEEQATEELARQDGQAAPAPAPDEAAPEKPSEAAGDRHPGLMDPSLATATAPDQYRLKFETTKGDFIVEVTRAWAPNGADRLYNLAQIGYYNDVAFFRLIGGFMAQFGIHGDGGVNAVWREARIADDPVTQSNLPGYLTFATAGPNTRTTQLFINYGNNASLDRQGFAPLGKVIEGMDIVNSLHKDYGERPNQGLIQSQGNDYLRKNFPELDYIKTLTIIE